MVSHLERRRLLTGGAALGIAGGALAAASRPAKALVLIPGGGTVPGGGSQEKVTKSVFDFGAVGDGVTDDSGAFNAALNYAGKQGQVVLVPGYTYAIKQPIVWSSSNDIGQPWGFQSQGAKLVSSITGQTPVISLISNNTVRYFQLTGALKIQGGGSESDGLHIYALGGSVYFYNALIDGLSVEGVGADGLVFEGDVFESTIMNSYFQDCGHNGATFAQSKGGVCSAIEIIGCFFNQNGNYGLCATNYDAYYGGTTDVRVFGGYCRDNQSYGFYYNNGTSGGLEHVGFENNCKAMGPGSANGAHVYGLVAVEMRACSGYNEYGGATYLLNGWWSGLTYLEGCGQSAGGAMAQTGMSRLVNVNGNSGGHVLMIACNGGVNVVSGTACTWEAQNCAGTSPQGPLTIRGTMQSA